MNIVPVRHYRTTDHRAYLFQVPDGQQLREGDLVLVKTKFGETTARCVCDSFNLEENPLKFIKIMFGATELMPVVGKLTIEQWEGLV